MAINDGGKGINARIEAAGFWAAGDNEIDRLVSLPAVQFATQQRANTDFDAYGGAARISIDVFNGNDWVVKPYLLLGGDAYDQDATTFFGNDVLNLTTDAESFSRFTLGYGLVLDQQVTERTRVRGAIAGRQHFGDTQGIFNSRFLATNAPVDGFTTLGFDVDDQYLIDAAVSHTFLNHWTVTASGFGEFGDLTGGGASLRLSKRF